LYQDKKVGGKKIYAAREWIAVSSSPAFQHPLFTTPSCPAGNPSPLHGKGTGVRLNEGVGNALKHEANRVKSDF